MSSKPNTTTTSKTGAKKAGSKKPKAEKGKLDGEETPITISGGSIIVESALEREETDVKKHKKCKINDTKGKPKWTLKSVGIYGPGMSWPNDPPLEFIKITNPDYSVVVVFQRP